MSAASTAGPRPHSFLTLPRVRLVVTVAAIAVLACAAVAWVAHSYAAASHLEVGRLRAERDDHQARQQRDFSPETLERFERLRALGLFATGDAVAWAEALTSAVSHFRLPPPTFDVTPREPAADADDGELNGLSMQQLRFRVDGLHEEELLQLLARLAQLAPGPFTVRECRLARTEREVGLSAQCALQWLVFPSPPKTGQGNGGRAS